MKNPMLKMLLMLAILFGLVFGYQTVKKQLGKKYMLAHAPIITVSTAKVTSQNWQSKIKASGSLRATQGVNVTTELAGLISAIYFDSGAEVKKGDRLLQLNDATEVAQLHSFEAQLALAKVTYERDKAQFKVHAVSQQVIDNDEANLKNWIAQVAQQKALIAKKNIRAPFTGKLGISQVDLGQYLEAGSAIVTLQALDPIYVDFYLPQQELVKISTGQAIIFDTDVYANKTFSGKISTIDPKVDPSTRNVQVEATIPNPKKDLLPGMFGTVEVTIGKPKSYLTVPQTAISFNPYGEIVYLVKEQIQNEKKALIATQTFVTVGETRGDQIAVLKGLKEGEQIVTAGQLKLKNGSKVVVNNAIEPSNNPYPKPIDK